MSERNTHKFQFQADVIAAAARTEAEYHTARVDHWQERADKAINIVRDSIGAKVVEHEVTSGSRYSVEVDYGDPAAWREFELASMKVRSHRASAERFRTDEQVYGTQGTTVFMLDTEDVHHFRLGGQPRED